MKITYLWVRVLAIASSVAVFTANRQGTVPAADGAPPPRVLYDTNSLPPEIRARTSFAAIFKKVVPSVVTVYSTKTVRQELQFPFDDPTLRRFFGGGDDEESQSPRRRRERVEHGLGSGVIVSPDGYILSNGHVVEDAQEIKVRLYSEGPDLDAKVVGTDPPTDLAVLKVEATTNLTPLVISDSANLQVGDQVLAVGNPFGVGSSVTMGIVSAVGRGGFGIVDYEDFIQTDASINPGNSGGALVDVLGRLVGVPTAILSRSGGSMGVGFAVPSSLARTVMDRIIEEGRVVRGYLGVTVQPITSDLASEFKLPGTAGALVGGVVENSPAAKAGLQPGDVIVGVDQEQVTDARHLRLRIAQTRPKTDVKLRILRGGKEQTVSAILGELPTEEVGRGAPEQPERAPKRRAEGFQGVEITDLSPRIRQQLGIPGEVQGAVVVNVEEDSPAANAGLRPGDVIQEINRQKVRNARETQEMSRKARENRALLRVWSRGGSRFVVIEAPKPQSKQ